MKVEPIVYGDRKVYTGCDTLDEVHALAKKYIKPEELRFAIIGPFEGEERFKNALGV